MPDLSWGEMLLRIALAGTLGGVIGLEREFRDREAGFRTHLLVALGSALFTLVFSAEETAREVAETLARKGIENSPDREGAYRFLTTGDVETFRTLGQRFLQLPLGAVEHVTIAQLEAAAA